MYPDMAGGVRLRNSYDTLGRAVSITLDGSPVASYVYNGTDQELPNGPPAMVPKPDSSMTTAAASFGPGS